MNLGEFVFGRRPVPTVLTQPPADATWRTVHPRRGPSVEAHLAQDNGFIRSPRGHMRYQAGQDYIVTRKDGEQSVVHRETFERTYRRRDDGQYEKRTDVVYRYFTLPHTVVVATREGPQRADAGDWIMQGLDGELWPVTAQRATEIYERA